ncbi:MAG: transaldolase [Bdellovibrionaceae bacterium]|nr:transaldolase [Pseudobdellovibrionaceae bacterium]NUM57226.1 transaldolase [Pseudobdellovibrionaceae bacterium]
MKLVSPFQNKIKIYTDGADKKSMLEMAGNPYVQGLTTNPSLMKKAGVNDYVSFCKEVLAVIKDKPISFEVFADDFTEMKRQALIINKWADNVYVKIPIMNSKGESSIPLIKDLSESGIKLNVTALFTWDQIQETVMAVKKGAPSVVSVFAGRIADSGRDPIPLMSVAADYCRTYGDQIELLWASTREVFNIVQAELCGCHIITAPPDVIKKISGFNKAPWDLSLETVKTFKTDSESAGFKI